MASHLHPHSQAGGCLQLPQKALGGRSNRACHSSGVRMWSPWYSLAKKGFQKEVHICLQAEVLQLGPHFAEPKLGRMI